MLDELLDALDREALGDDETFLKSLETEEGCERIFVRLRWPEGSICCVVLEVIHPEGRPCCGRLNKEEYGVPRDDPETDAGEHGTHDDPVVHRFYLRLWERGHGGVSRKYLAACLTEHQFLARRRNVSGRRRVTEIALLALRTRPWPHRELFAAPRAALPAHVGARWPAVLAAALEARSPRPGGRGPTRRLG